eukprot:CAMPEP_0176030834 /NCGR_PEP_ID=MMETSP0120_2-20121206/15184_1 /TAXON_ID=160619 /ORGANISM="Kryptoperidinium foliaceum, Strain CCMP 1326" /LENGTH=249 /DNA_ID=CAMNT_0017364101 /DNA_START=620 /DNA_END=1369 /DNA_ORIENTATION=-
MAVETPLGLLTLNILWAIRPVQGHWKLHRIPIGPRHVQIVVRQPLWHNQNVIIDQHVPPEAREALQGLSIAIVHCGARQSCLATCAACNMRHCVGVVHTGANANDVPEVRREPPPKEWQYTRLPPVGEVDHQQDILKLRLEMRHIKRLVHARRLLPAIRPRQGSIAEASCGTCKRRSRSVRRSPNLSRVSAHVLSGTVRPCCPRRNLTLIFECLPDGTAPSWPNMPTERRRQGNIYQHRHGPQTPTERL